VFASNFHRNENWLFADALSNDERKRVEVYNNMNKVGCGYHVSLYILYVPVCFFVRSLHDVLRTFIYVYLFAFPTPSLCTS
jgi:hypothetical protein